MSVGRDLGKFSGDYRKALTAVMLVGIMLFSTQMYSFQDFETYDEKSSVVGDAQDREPFQQSGQAEWPPSDISQPTGVQQHFFNHPAFTDPSFHDQMSYYGKVSDPSALMMQPEYAFFLEETDADDHDNDGIGDLSDLDDDNDGINDLIEMFDGCFGTHPFDHDNRDINHGQEDHRGHSQGMAAQFPPN